LSLRNLMAVISYAGLVISGATGPMHIASGLSIPTLSFISNLTRYHPRRWHPLNHHYKVLLPKFERRIKSSNPFDSITIVEVIDAINNLLNLK
jgi:ADP-heptose:LPS heptosyltransferase